MACARVRISHCRCLVPSQNLTGWEWATYPGGWRSPAEWGACFHRMARPPILATCRAPGSLAAFHGACLQATGASRLNGSRRAFTACQITVSPGLAGPIPPSLSAAPTARAAGRCCLVLPAWRPSPAATPLRPCRDAAATVRGCFHGGGSEQRLLPARRRLAGSCSQRRRRQLLLGRRGCVGG
jgi:hypothetical protein